MKINQQKRRLAFFLVLLLLFSAFALPIGATGTRVRKKVLLGGVPFGVRFFTDGIMVVGYSDVRSGGKRVNPAREAGLRPGDCIYKINEETPHTAADLAAAIEKYPPMGGLVIPLDQLPEAMKKLNGKYGHIYRLFRLVQAKL